MIDGGYAHHIQKVGPWIDFLKFSNKICQDTERIRTYYYTCYPYQSNPPTDEEKSTYSKTDKFIKKLISYPRFEVKLGKLQKIDGVYRQKGVDVMLSIDLVTMSRGGKIDKAIIIAGDSDFVYAVQAAKDAGIITELYYSDKLGINNDLLQVFDETKIIDDKLISECKKILRVDSTTQT